jgi:hypothetical protein
MADEIKPNPKAEALAKAKAEQESQADALKKLKESIGRTFTDGIRTGSVIGFEPVKMLAARPAPAYLVNFGNPNASHYIHCDVFAQTFTMEVKG